MALIPKINICLESLCNRVNIYEETSPYIAVINPGGWGAPNIDTTSITVANLKVYDYTGVTLLDTITLYDGVTDVYAAVAGTPTPGSFLAVEDHVWTQGDGIFELVYLVNTLTNSTQHVLFTCSLETCMNKLRVKLVTECDAKKLEEYKGILSQLEVFLYGINSAFSCGEFARVNTLITTAATICATFLDCNTSCSGC